MLLQFNSPGVCLINWSISSFSSEYNTCTIASKSMAASLNETKSIMKNEEDAHSSEKLFEFTFYVFLLLVQIMYISLYDSPLHSGHKFDHLDPCPLIKPFEWRVTLFIQNPNPDHNDYYLGKATHQSENDLVFTSTNIDKFNLTAKGLNQIAVEARFSFRSVRPLEF